MVQVGPHLQGIDYRLTDFIRNFICIPENEIKAFFEMANNLSFFAETSNGNIKALIFEVIDRISVEQQITRLKQIQRLLDRQITEERGEEKYDEFVKEQKLESCLENIVIFLNFERLDILDVLDKLNVPIPTPVVTTLLLIAPEKIKKVVKIYKVFADIVSFFEYSGILEASYGYLQERLGSDLPAQTKLNYAELIIKEQESLLLYDQHPLLEAAIETVSVCDPQTLQTPKSPYRIYKMLQEIDEPLMDIKGLWDLAPLRNSMSEFVLPEGLDESLLTKLFDALQKRLSDLSREKRRELKNHIASSTENQNVASLRSNLLAKPLFKELLMQKEGASKTQLLWILKALSDADTTRKEGELLSQQEQMLLTVSESIQMCLIGQKENLNEFYQNLPIQYRPMKLKGEDNPVENVIYTCMQQALNDLLSNEELLKKFISNMSQVSHHTLFLKNRFYKQLGLKHQLTFDLYTGVLDDRLVELIEKEPQEVLSTCLNHLVPRLVAQRFIQDSLFLLKDKSVWLKITELLEKAAGEKFNSESYYKYIEFKKDEEGEVDMELIPLRFTEEGVFALLKALGYITWIPSL